jgi:hypothetical protein
MLLITLILTSGTCLAPRYFSNLSQKRHYFRNKIVIEYKMCALLFYTKCIRNISHSKNKWSKIYVWVRLKYPTFLYGVNEPWIFLTGFRKLLKFHENPSVVSRVFPCGRTDRQTDMTTVVVAFSNLANAPKTLILFTQHLACFLNCNPLTPNDHYRGRTAPLTSRRCILNTYPTNIRTEYFKHAAQSPFFSLQISVYFIMLPCLVPVLFTF